MSTTKENDAPPARPPVENAGVLVEDVVAADASTPAAASEPSSGARTLENDAAPARAETEHTTAAVDGQAPPALAPSSAEAPQLKSVVALPPRPRLRVSYWFEGDKLNGEAVLMNERRELVKRAMLDMSDPVLARIFTYVIAQVTREDVLVPPSDESQREHAPEDPSSSEEETAPEVSSSEETPTTAREGAASSDDATKEN
jgi:hypothetical protein